MTKAFDNRVELPGTALSEKDFAEGNILFNHDELRGDFAWDTGIAIGQYLAGVERGPITGRSLQYLPQGGGATAHGLRMVLPADGRICPSSG